MTEQPRLRTDLVLVEQTYRGEQSFIVKDPSTRKYFRFRPLEVAVMQSLDGLRSPAEAAASLAEQGIKVTAATVARFAEKLKTMGLCERTLRESTVLLMERLRAQRRKRLRTGPFQGDLLRLRWSVGDPDRFMDRTIPYLKVFFTRGFLMTSVALFAVYFAILALKWSEFVKEMSDVYLLRASLRDYVLLWAVTMVIVAVHELAHGYTCKYFGGKVHEIGAMIFYFELAFFCNVNDAWTFPERKARLWVTAAGSWIEMVVASIAAIVWWIAAPGTFLSDVGLAFFLVGGLAAVLVNLNPLIPLDGYYALSDWLEVPNLRQRAFAHLTWTIRSRWLGQDLPMPPADEREQRIFLLYGILATAYTGMVFFVAGAIAYGWLSRVFGAVGVAALVVLVWLVTRSVRRSLRQTLADAWRETRARWAASGRMRRVQSGLGGLALGVAVAGLLPWPITVVGPFVVSPTVSGILVVPDSGVVVEVLVSEGSRVGAGAPLGTGPKPRARARRGGDVARRGLPPPARRTGSSDGSGRRRRPHHGSGAGRGRPSGRDGEPDPVAGDPSPGIRDRHFSPPRHPGGTDGLDRRYAAPDEGEWDRGSRRSGSGRCLPGPPGPTRPSDRASGSSGPCRGGRGQCGRIGLARWGGGVPHRSDGGRDPASRHDRRGPHHAAAEQHLGRPVVGHPEPNPYRRAALNPA